MGPRSEERGEVMRLPALCRPPTPLQWGRAPRSAERSGRQSSSRHTRCFNGAALRGARREKRDGDPVPCDGSASMGPRSEERGEKGLLPLPATATPASMGPRSEERGEGVPRFPGNRRRPRASMGPRSEERGEGAGIFAELASKPASMGPRSEERGELDFRYSPKSALVASMGPRSEERGERPVARLENRGRCERFNGAALRGARRENRRPRPRRWRSCFNGAALRGARRGWHVDGAERCANALQWGRAPRSAESLERGAGGGVDSTGFNGAALRGARRAPRGIAMESTTGGFNGAALRGARRAASASAHSRSATCFNGAALRGARRERKLSAAPQARPRFNGAALRGARRGRRRRQGQTISPASMGPRSEERGEGAVDLGLGELGVLQWGRAPRSAESRQLCLPLVRLPAGASMGPRSEERGEQEVLGARAVG